MGRTLLGTRRKLLEKEVDRVGSIRDGAKDKCERSHPEDGCKAEDGNMGGDDQDLPLKGPLVQLEVRLGAEVLLSHPVQKMPK